MHGPAAGFSFGNAQFRYRPFPIGLARPVMAPDVYEAMLDNYPDQELFAYIPKLGHKYSLSEKFNRDGFFRFVKTNPVWGPFYQYVKSNEFIRLVLELLEAHQIRLGSYKFRSAAAHRWRACLDMAVGNGYQRRLEARFEFSMLPADGGFVVPHTDQPRKLITLVVSMVRPGEWDPAWGGGTDVNTTASDALAFNHMNRIADFSDMTVVHTYAFEPNQAVIFVKTFNSWHSVRPMTGTGSPAMRRTLTINIEEF